MGLKIVKNTVIRIQQNITWSNYLHLNITLLSRLAPGSAPGPQMKSAWDPREP